MATQNLGALGMKTSEPASIRWHWYNHIPDWPMWLVLGLLLVGLKENRTWRAWLMLLPVMVVPILLGMVERLFAMAPSTTETVRWPLVTLSLAWAALWLLGRRLAGRSPATCLLSAVGVLYATACVSQCAHFGAFSTESIQMWILYTTSALALLFGMALAGVACKKTYSRKRFMGYLFLWTFLGLAGVVTTFMAFTIVMMSMVMGWSGISELAVTMLMGLLVATVYAAAIYLMNLPFMLVIFNSRTYRERFEQIFRLPVTQAGVL